MSGQGRDPASGERLPARIEVEKSGGAIDHEHEARALKKLLHQPAFMPVPEKHEQHDEQVAAKVKQVLSDPRLLAGNEVAYHRAISTVIGGSLALSVRLIVIRYRKQHQTR